MCFVCVEKLILFPQPQSIKTFIFRSPRPQLRRLHPQPAPGGDLRRVSSEPLLGGSAVEPAGEPQLPFPETGGIDEKILDTLDYLASIPEEQWWQPYSPKETIDGTVLIKIRVLENATVCFLSLHIQCYIQPPVVYPVLIMKIRTSRIVSVV